MMPVIRISDATYAHLQRHAKPFEDSPESIIIKALAALDMMNSDTVPPLVRPEQTKRNDRTKLPQKEFRLPLLMALLKVGGSAPAKEIRAMMDSLMAHRLGEGDYESVSTGDPRWWNAVCWERSDLVKLGLMRDDSERGVWEISDTGKKLRASLHRKENGTDRMVAEGSLAEMAERFWRKPIGPRPFIMIDEMVFEEIAALNPILLKPIDELRLSVRSANCLRNDQIYYLGDLVRKTVDELLGTPNFGRKSVVEITEMLESMGLKLGMEVQNWPPENIGKLAASAAENDYRRV